MKRALVLTVGTGSRADVNIVNPLVKTIIDTRPDYILFIVSQTSVENADKIVQRLGDASLQYKKRILSDEDDLVNIFSEINQEIRCLYEQGFSADDIVADYTSGTKAMTGALVLIAIFHSFCSLKYITGQRRDGIVQDGTEKFLSVPPLCITARRTVLTALRLMEEMRFVSAIRLFQEINTALLDEYEKSLREHAQRLAEAYDAWDKFDHFNFFSRYNKVSFAYKELQPFKINNNAQDVLEIGKTIKDGRISEMVLCDLYNNAVRRYYEGRYDDAVARLYRLVEMIAQYVLYTDYGLDTSNVVIDKIDEKARGDLVNYRDPVDNRIKIGMRRSFKLLYDLSNSIGKAFFDSDPLQGILNTRNSSILAHGTVPVNQEACRRLFEEIITLIEKRFDNFLETAQQIQFPWIKDIECMFNKEKLIGN